MSQLLKIETPFDYEEYRKQRLEQLRKKKPFLPNDYSVIKEDEKFFYVLKNTQLRPFTRWLPYSDIRITYGIEPPNLYKIVQMAYPKYKGNSTEVNWSWADVVQKAIDTFECPLCTEGVPIVDERVLAMFKKPFSLSSIQEEFVSSNNPKEELNMADGVLAPMFDVFGMKNINVSTMFFGNLISEGVNALMEWVAPSDPLPHLATKILSFAIPNITGLVMKNVPQINQNSPEWLLYGQAYGWSQAMSLLDLLAKSTNDGSFAENKIKQAIDRFIGRATGMQNPAEAIAGMFNPQIAGAIRSVAGGQGMGAKFSNLLGSPNAYQDPKLNVDPTLKGKESSEKTNMFTIIRTQ